MTAIIFLKGLPISTIKVKLIDNYNHQFLIALYSSTQFPVSVFQGSNCTAVAMYFNLSKQLNFTRVYILFQGRLPKQKKVNVEQRKVRQRQHQGYGRLRTKSLMEMEEQLWILTEYEKFFSIISLGNIIRYDQ